MRACGCHDTAVFGHRDPCPLGEHQTSPPMQAGPIRLREAWAGSRSYEPEALATAPGRPSLGTEVPADGTTMGCI